MHITMTTEQTAAYDDGDDFVTDALMRQLRKEAQSMANQSGTSVTVYTAETAEAHGIVALVVEPQMGR